MTTAIPSVVPILYMGRSSSASAPVFAAFENCRYAESFEYESLSALPRTHTMYGPSYSPFTVISK